MHELATAKVAELEAQLSYLTVSVPDDSRIEGLTLTRDGAPLEPRSWNRALPVDGGDHIIAAYAPGREKWQTVVHVPVDGARVSVEVPELAVRREVAAAAGPARTRTEQVAQAERSAQREVLAARPRRCRP